MVGFAKMPVTSLYIDDLDSVSLAPNKPNIYLRILTRWNPPKQMTTTKKRYSLFVCDNVNSNYFYGYVTMRWNCLFTVYKYIHIGKIDDFIDEHCNQTAIIYQCKQLFAISSVQNIICDSITTVNIIFFLLVSVCINFNWTIDARERQSDRGWWNE